MKRLAICGTHSATRDLIPFDDPSVEIWTWNDAACNVWFSRYDAMLEIHAPDVYTKPQTRSGKDYWLWLQEKHGKPCYMQAADPRVPDSVAYPLDEVLALIPYRYLGSSCAYALALAVYLGYQNIDVYGVELATNTEYSYQAENWRFWVGYAIGKGINLHLISGLALFTGKLYGYDGQASIPGEYYQARAADLQIDYINAAAASVQAEFDALLTIQNDIASAAGKIQAYQRAALNMRKAAACLKRCWECNTLPGQFTRQDFERESARAKTALDPLLADMYRAEGKVQVAWGLAMIDRSKEAIHQLRQFLSENIRLAEDAGEQLGLAEENHRYLLEIDSLSTAVTGELSGKEL